MAAATAGGCDIMARSDRRAYGLVIPHNERPACVLWMAACKGRSVGDGVNGTTSNNVEEGSREASMDFARRQEHTGCPAQLVVMDNGQKIVHACTSKADHTADHEARYPATPTNPVAVWVYWSKERRTED